MSDGRSIKAYLEESAIKVGAKFQQPRSGDAGYDLYSSEAVTLFSQSQVLVQTGLFLEIPEGMVGVIKDRSSMALRRVYTHAGVIDASYRGAVTVMLANESEKAFHVEPGQRIAQLLFVRCYWPGVEIISKDKLSATSRGDGAFGSTGK